jgi:hemerythrin superfamily protein
MNTGSDIYTKLKDDHQSVSSLLQQMVQTTATEISKRKALLSDLKHRLTSHSKAEEATFYSVLLQHESTRGLIQKGQQEHHRVESLLHELDRMDPSDPQWSAKLQTLKGLVEHHVHEEEGPIFAQARTILSASQVEDLGQKFDQAMTGQTVAQAQATAESHASQATAKTRETGEHVRHEGQRLAEEAKAKGRSVLHDQQHFLAAQIGNVAQALHKTAQQLGEQDQDQSALAQYTNQAADGLERFSHNLRDRELSSVIGQVEDFARRQPMAFIGGAAVLGFLASRFLKSSAEGRSSSDRPAPAEEPSAGSHTTTASGVPAEDADVGVPSAGRPTTTTPYGGQ